MLIVITKNNKNKTKNIIKILLNVNKYITKNVNRTIIILINMIK